MSKNSLKDKCRITLVAAIIFGGIMILQACDGGARQYVQYDMPRSSILYFPQEALQLLTFIEAYPAPPESRRPDFIPPVPKPSAPMHPVPARPVPTGPPWQTAYYETLTPQPAHSYEILIPFGRYGWMRIYDDLIIVDNAAVIDFAGNYIVPPGRHEVIRQILDGYVVVSDRQYRSGIYDFDGNAVIPIGRYRWVSTSIASSV